MFLSFFNAAHKSKKQPTFSIADIAFMQTAVYLPVKKRKWLIQQFRNGGYSQKITYLSDLTERENNGRN